MTKKKIGILGGSFNPIHKAHTSLADYFISRTNAEKVIFVPCNVSPFKTKDDIASSIHRMAMVSLAIKEIPKFEISDFEVNKKGISYTYETIEYFSKLFPNNRLCLLIGGDQAENFHRWKNWEKILDLADIYVALRKGYKIPTYKFEVYKKAVYLEMPFIDISASEIREKISNDERGIEYLNSKVEKYILEQGLYKS